MDASTERSLLERAQGGDERAFLCLVEPCWLGLFRVCNGIIHDRDLAEHTAYSAIEKAYWKIDTCREKFRPWLYSIARNLARDIVKSPDYQRTVELSDPNIARAVTVEVNSFEDAIVLKIDLEELIIHLEPQYQAILDLRYYDGLGFNEIADVLDISPEAARKLHERAVKALRRLIERGGPQ